MFDYLFLRETLAEDQMESLMYHKDMEQGKLIKELADQVWTISNWLWGSILS